MNEFNPIDHFVPTPDGTGIHVRELPGEGQPVVFLHGFTGNCRAMQVLADASRMGRPALLIDLVGHGSSDAPDYLAAYEMRSVVDQVLATIGTVAPGTIHLVGYSMGGRVALSMAARAPWYFASLTTISSMAGIADPVERARRHDADHALADRVEAIGVPAFIDEWLQHPLFTPLREALDADQLRDTVDQRQLNTVRGLANSLRGTGTGSMPPVWDDLRSVHTPVLALAGSRDDRYVAYAEQLANHARSGIWQVVPGSGHALPLENPHAVATIVADFLEGCETSTSP